MSNTTKATDGIINEKERLFLFNQIDPLIRLLLVTINQSPLSLSRQRGKKVNSLTNEKVVVEEEQVLSNLRIQHRLLVKLTNVFDSFCSADEGQEDEEFQGGLVDMSEYILLPLTQILRGTSGQKDQHEQCHHQKQDQESAVIEEKEHTRTVTNKGLSLNEGDTEDKKRKRYRMAWIRKSSQRKCIEQSAIVLVSYLNSITYGRSQKSKPKYKCDEEQFFFPSKKESSSFAVVPSTYEEEKGEDAAKVKYHTPKTNERAASTTTTKPFSPAKVAPSLRPNIVVQCLITCATALQHLDDDSEKQEIDDNEKGLDDDTSCIKEILRCVESLVSHGSKRPDDKQKYNCNHVTTVSSEKETAQFSDNDDDANCAKNEFSAKHFAVATKKLSPTANEIVKVMDGALIARLTNDCLSKLVPPSSPSPLQRKYDHNDTPLKIQSLATLRAMISYIPSIDIWMSLFPGCFARLFKASISNLGGVPCSSSSYISPRIASMSIEILSCLLDLVIAHSPPMSPPNLCNTGIVSDTIDHIEIGSDRVCGDNDDNEMIPVSMTVSAAVTAVTLVEASKIQTRSKRIDKTTTKTVKENNNTDNTTHCWASSLEQQQSKISFFKEISKRIPKPLLTLIRLMPAHNNKRVRRSGCFLCWSVLAMTTSIFPRLTRTGIYQQQDEKKEEEIDTINIDLERTAMECCLALTEDNDPLVVSSSRRVLISYCTFLGPKSWKDKLSDTIAPRIAELIEELPALAQRSGGVGREADLISQVNLIRGYLSLAANSIGGSGSEKRHLDNKTPNSRRCGRGCAISDALACESASVAIRKSLAETLALDLDFTAMPTSSILSCSSTADPYDGDGGGTGITRPRFLHLRSDAAAEATKRMVRLFGSVIGTKQAAVFVDSCIADLFEACCERATSHASPKIRMSTFCRSDQVDWLHKWVGSLVFVNELLIGLLSPEFDTEEYAWATGTRLYAKVEHGADSPQHHDSILDRKSTKRIFKLTSSILPVITSAPLWNLPTTVDDVVAYETQLNTKELTNHHESRDASTYLAHDNARFFSSYCDQCSTWPESSTIALNGNAIFIGCLIEMVGNLINLLGQSVHSFFPTLLYPLIEKSCHSRHYHIHNSAQKILERVAQCAGAKTVHLLVVQNFDYLVEVVTSRAHSLTASVSFSERLVVLRTLPRIVEMLLKSVVKEATGKNHHNKYLSTSVRYCFRSQHISLLADLVERMIAAFNDKLSKASDSLDLIRVFSAMIEYFQLSLKDNNTEQETVPTDDRNIIEDSWLDLLSEFVQDNERQCITANDEKDERCPAEAFAQYNSSNSVDNFDEGEEATDVPEAEDFSSNRKFQLSGGETKIVKLILSRCCFSLYSSNLLVQVAACETLVSGFGYLAAVEKRAKTIAASDESTGSPLMSTVGEFWPTITDRFRSATASLMGIQKLQKSLSSPQEVEYSNKVSDSGTEIYFVRLLSVISSLCKFSGDFMAGKIENDIWPLIAQLFGRTMEMNSRQCVKKSLTKREYANDTTPVCSVHDKNREIVLHGILDFLQILFSDRSCGSALSHLVPIAGTIILPLISHDSSAGTAACVALKSMLTVDSDWILRALLTLAGLEIPTKPLTVPIPNLDSMEISESDNAFMGKAKELLKYAEGLPEQAIL